MVIKNIYIDVETTGTDPKKHGIIQLAGIVEIDGEERASFDYKMAPFPNDEIVQDALEVHGHTLEQIKEFEAPAQSFRSFKKLIGEYVDKYNRADKFQLVAYNAGFDDSFLREWFRKNNDNYYGSFFFWPPIDAANMAAVHFLKTRGTFPNFKLLTVARALGIEVDETKAHDAMYDIKITREMFKKLQEGVVDCG